MSLASLGYAVGWRVVRALPEPVAQGLFRAAADVAVRRGGRGIDRLSANLDRVAPGQDLTRQAMRSYARYWCEVFRLPSVGEAALKARTTTVDEHLLRESVAGPRGTLMVLPHTGNWDAAGAWCGVTGVPFTTVAERLQPESLYEQFLAFRQSLGMEVLPLGPGAFDVLEQRLRAGGTLCLLADRDLTANGLDVGFFGATARMPSGPARLALTTGANLLPTTLSFTAGGWRIRFHPYVEHTDVQTMTQAVASAFEDAIREYPADWHMLQRLWVDDLEPAR
jgi:lauroyl/myristoyl acyltransferase